MPPLAMPDRTWWSTPSTLNAPVSVSVPQIRTPDRLVALDLRRRAGDHDASGLQQIGLLRDLQRQTGVLLDQEDRHAFIGADAMHDREDLLHDQRRQAE